MAEVSLERSGVRQKEYMTVRAGKTDVKWRVKRNLRAEKGDAQAPRMNKTVQRIFARYGSNPKLRENP